MISGRNGTIALMCALSAGCFLDESPRTATGSIMGETGSSAPRTGFTPRDPGVTTGRGSEKDASAAETAMDASMDAAPAPEAGAMPTASGNDPKDAGRMHASDAHVTPIGMDAAPAKHDATTPPPTDAQVVADAGAPAMPDAHVAEDAAIRMLPMPIHRYEFTGSGRVATDSIGGADGELRPGSFLDGSGSVTSTMRSEDVGVELPEGLLADLNGFTIVGWLDVRSEDCWQRLFDFTFVTQRGMGMGTGNGNRDVQASALFVTPFGCPDGVPTAGYVTEQMQYRVASPRPVLRPRNLMLGVMYDSATRMLQLVVDGTVQSESRVPINLKELARARAGLGRAYFDQDSPLNGSIHELRIYAQTLDAQTLSELAKRGPDQL